MKKSFMNRVFALVLAAALFVGMPAAAFAKPQSGSIKFDKVNVTIQVGESVTVGITYDVDDMSRLYFSELERGIVDVKFLETRAGEDVNYATITGLKEGTTTVFLYAGKIYGRIQVKVGRGAKAAAMDKVNKDEEKLIANDDSALGAALAAELKKAAEKQREVTITSNDETIPRNTLKALSARSKAAKKNAIIIVNSRDSSNEVVARLYVEPQKLTTLKTDLKTGVSIDSARKAALEKTYSNRLWVVKCAQSGSFGASLEIAAKLGGVPSDVSKLAVYNVGADGKFTKIEEPSCFIEKDGFLHFFTKQAGEIVISDGALVKR